MEIAKSDSYSQNQSLFDRSAKTMTLGAVSEKGYLENAARHVHGWTLDEVAYLTRVIAVANQRMQDLKLAVELPETIVIVKTDGWEEGGANGYTRANAIYLNRNSLSEKLLLHEFFHVISRYNAAKIDKIYATLGFRRCNEVAFDLDTKITNPDAPFLRHYISLRVNGEPIEAVLALVATRAYAGGGFFGYVGKKIVAVEGPDDAKVVRTVDGAPLMYDHRVAIDLYDQIGRNTAYTIHQEEVSADHFEMLMSGETGARHPHLVEALHRALAS
ncbi:hypothetical protein [Sandaracinobacteroides hominis]|uniref:hypothetical protein n=1 Tax=Sandaracinobacteroides hominis TaxID=2780086 RepID=UPI0018F49809|nr:hypothetical protein [Sandaracinobacteroides hominis]